MASVKKRTKKALESLIIEASTAYYNTGIPIMSDAEFDKIKEELEERFPKSKVLDIIGAPIEQTDTKKIKLPYHMGSMDKRKPSNEKAILDWTKKYNGSGYVITDKLDGVSALLCIDCCSSVNAKVKGSGGRSDIDRDEGVCMYTRGNGKVGQNITSIIPIIKNGEYFDGIKNRVRKMGFNGHIAIRGELIINKEDYKTIHKPGMNSRNTVSGVVNAKVPNTEYAKVIQFVAYDIISDSGPLAKKLADVDHFGLTTVHSETIGSADEINASVLTKVLKTRKTNSEFEIDGIIITHGGVNEINTDKNPKYAFAFKLDVNDDVATVKVKEVTWDVSKHNILQPVIHFDAVQLDNVSVAKATGINAKFILSEGIGKGAIIEVIRSGSVIPKVINVVKKSTERSVLPPTGSYVWDKNEVHIVSSQKNSAALEKKKLYSFFKTLETMNLGEKTTDKLYDNGLNTVGKISAATKEDLLKIEGIKDKSAMNIINSVRESIGKASCIDLMVASGVFEKGIGVTRLTSIEEVFPNIGAGGDRVPSVEEMSEKVPGINVQTASMIAEGIPKAIKFLENNGIDYKKKCGDAGDNKEPGLIASLDAPAAKVTKDLNGWAKDLAVVFTGIRDKELEKSIKANGGSVKSTFSKKVTHVIVSKDDYADTGTTLAAADNVAKGNTVIMSLQRFKSVFNK